MHSPTTPSHVVIISPHLDDAVLSCGGLINNWSSWAHIEIWTVFTKSPLFGPWSPLAKWLSSVSGGYHPRLLNWIRRREDQHALQVVGCHHFRHLGFKDAVYRKDSDGHPRYKDCCGVPRHREDGKCLNEIQRLLNAQLPQPSLLVAPLGLGEHVDHVLVADACRDLRHPNTMWYADLPYALNLSEVQIASRQSLKAVSFCLHNEDLAAWKKAISCYRTQLKMLSTGELRIDEDIVAQWHRNQQFHLFQSVSTNSRPNSYDEPPCMNAQGPEIRHSEDK